MLRDKVEGALTPVPRHTACSAKALQKATESVYSAIPNWTPGLHATVKKILAS